MQRTRQKHGRRSYLSVGIGGDSQSLLERDPLRSNDRGLLSYINIDIMPKNTYQSVLIRSLADGERMPLVLFVGKAERM